MRKNHLKGIVLFEQDHCLIPGTHKGQLIWVKVSDEDAAALSAHSWWERGQYMVTKIEGKLRTMHTCVAGPAPGELVSDHINRDKV